MKYSESFIKTNKSAKNFDSKNATLLIKGSFIDQVMAGAYTFLPLGLRVLHKIENIVRKEMDLIGAEIVMPQIVPTSLWETTNRIDSVDILMKTKPANDKAKALNSTEYILNPTHEDTVTPLAKKMFSSYKNFPFAVYQIQTKFRNEARPKAGLLRGREFRMKDLYSFHTSEEDLLDYYNNKAMPAYKKVFEALGMGEITVVALASGGDFTKNFSHEFQTKCDAGEDLIFYDKKEDIYYNREVTPSQSPKWFDKNETEKEIEEVYGENIVTVEKLAKFLNIEVKRTTKTILFETEEGKVIAAALQGNYEIDEDKLIKIVGCKTLSLAKPETVKRVTNAEIGYAGVLNLPDEVEVYFDNSMQGRKNFETGGNKTDYHTINVNFGRDLPLPEKFYDFKVAQEGDLNPNTGEVYKVFKAAEVGNIFPLKTKFTKAFDYKFVDKDGKQKQVFMGSYGIGTSRIMGVIAEIFNDEKGLTWPKQIAPFHVYLIGIGEEGNKKAEGIYEQLTKANIEVLFDNRVDVSPGEKFKDSDLIGIPVRIVVSDRTLEHNQAEFKLRTEKDTSMVELDKIIPTIEKFIS